MTIQNAKTIKKPERTSFLLAGPPGAGKTTMLHTMPCRGFVYGFDANIESAIMGADVDYELISGDTLDIDVHPLKSKAQEKVAIAAGKPPQAYIEFEKSWRKNLSNGTLDKYPFWWFDSASTFLMMIMDRVQWLNGRLGKHPEQADWTAQMHTFHSVMREALYRKKIVIMTAHEKEVTKDNQPNTWQLALTGDLRIRIPLLFTNIYRVEADRERHFITTVSDPKHRYIRNSIRGLPADLEVTITDWNHPTQFGLGRIMVEAGLLPGPSFKTSIMVKPGTVATAKPGVLRPRLPMKRR